MNGPHPADFREYLALWAPRIDEELDRILPAGDRVPTSIHEAMRYSVFAGGKRLRPCLVLAGARVGGGREEDVLGVACAVEMVHTYSLIHDDLPAMDDDDFRRGRPSCHRQFGEAMAILAGDALATLAFEVTATRAPRPERAGRLVAILARAAGTLGMVGGQVADLEGEGREPTLDAVRWIHEHKTAALLNASLELGAVGVGAAPQVVTGLCELGWRLGLAFQIVDDVLDESADMHVLGKTPGKDRESGKLTYPAAVGIEASKEIAEQLVAEARCLIDGLPERALLEGLCDLMVTRRA